MLTVDKLQKPWSWQRAATNIRVVLHQIAVAGAEVEGHQHGRHRIDMVEGPERARTGIRAIAGSNVLRVIHPQ